MCAATMFVAATNVFNTGELVNVIGGVTVDIFGAMAGVDNKNYNNGMVIGGVGGGRLRPK